MLEKKKDENRCNYNQVLCISNMASSEQFSGVSSNKMCFKCCKNKEFNYFYCVNCLSVFHKSCLLRSNKNSIKFLSDNKIKCCDSISSDDEINIIPIYEEKISELKEETDQMRKYIKKIKMNVAD